MCVQGGWRGWEQLFLTARDQGAQGEIITGKGGQESGPPALAKGLNAQPKQKRKLLKDFKHKSDLSLSLFFVKKLPCHHLC